MKKILTIEIVENDKGQEIKFKSEGLTVIEIIGLLTVYRNQQEKEFLDAQTPKEIKEEGSNGD